MDFENFGTFGDTKWIKSNTPLEYLSAIDWMEKTVKKIQSNEENNIIWLLEHQNVITGGSLSKKEELINFDNLPVIKTRRGGQWTWHGPGQRVIYILMNLSPKNRDIKNFVRNLEETIIKTLENFDIESFRRDGLPGVWVKSKKNNLDKIAAIGIRVSKWVSYHGISININPKLKYFENIVPCGIKNGGVTSFSQLGFKTTLNDFDIKFSQNFSKVFK